MQNTIILIFNFYLFDIESKANAASLRIAFNKFFHKSKVLHLDLSAIPITAKIVLFFLMDKYKAFA